MVGAVPIERIGSLRHAKLLCRAALLHRVADLAGKGGKRSNISTTISGMKKGGLIDNPLLGVWVLTPRGAAELKRFFSLVPRTLWAEEAIQCEEEWEKVLADNPGADDGIKEA